MFFGSFGFYAFNFFNNEVSRMKSRRGMSLLEMAVAGVLLVVLAAVCVKFFAAAALQRKGMEQRQTALREAGNIMERLFARPYDELTAESAAKITLPAEVVHYLPKAELKIDLAAAGEGSPGKRISIVIRWQDSEGQWVEPARLVAWRHP
jgi:Tfp pilus assembly protein PilE